MKFKTTIPSRVKIIARSVMRRDAIGEVGEIEDIVDAAEPEPEPETFRSRLAKYIEEFYK